MALKMKYFWHFERCSIRLLRRHKHTPILPRDVGAEKKLDRSDPLCKIWRTGCSGEIAWVARLPGKVVMLSLEKLVEYKDDHFE